MPTAPWARLSSSLPLTPSGTMASCFHNLFARSTSTTAKVHPPDVIDTLFPLPTKYPPSLLSPRALPGSSPETEKALLEILKDNHRNHHIFFNDLGHVE